MHTIRHRYGRCVMLGMFVALLLVTQATATDMIIHMGNDAALKWIWRAQAELPGSFYALVIGAERAKEVLNRLPQHLRSEAFKDIDFERQAAIVAYLGEAPRGGYAVDIHSVQISDHQVWVNISRRAPGPDEITTLAITYPIAVKSLPLADLPKDGYEVRFVDQNGVLLSRTDKIGSISAPTGLVLGDDSLLRWRWTHDKPLPGELYALVTSRTQANRVASLLPEELAKDAFGKVNFNKQIAVIAYLGDTAKNGYAVGIHSIQIDGRHIRITVARRSHSTNKTVMKRPPQPIDVQVVSRTLLPKGVFAVEFVDQEGTLLPQTYFVTLP